MDDKKQYPVGSEIAGEFITYEAAIDLRNTAIKLPFGYKKALKASKDAVKYRHKFWKHVKELYPELKDNNLNYDRESQTVYKIYSNE